MNAVVCMFNFIVQCAILLVSASDQGSVASDGDLESRTRVAILQLETLCPFPSSFNLSITTRDGALQKVAEWIMGGVPEAVGLLKYDDSKRIASKHD